MRTISRTSRFRKDYKRELKGRYGASLSAELSDILPSLVTDRPLLARHRDHALAGEWKDCRDCHVKPDLVMIYRLLDERSIELVRLGSHSELGL
jgi:mRNA interferase YafQ